MSETTFQTRIQNKSDTEQNWNAKSSFVPLKGEIIVYEGDNKIKIGDGVTTLSNLPFIVSETTINEKLDDYLLKSDYEGGGGTTITTEDWTFTLIDGSVVTKKVATV